MSLEVTWRCWWILLNFASLPEVIRMLNSIVGTAF